jgi:hypothetical protein
MGSGLRTGFRALDGLLDISSGIITLRSDRTGWLSRLAANILVRNHRPGSKALYLHWVDYHRRYWTLDFDLLAAIAKNIGAEPGIISDEIFFVRAFSRDNIEQEENWRMMDEFSDGVSLMILDSVSELHDPQARKGMNQKTMTYALGRFTRLCLKNNCFGLILDHALRPIHPFLGEASSVVINFRFEGSIMMDLIKHPCLPDALIELPRGAQRTLRGWLR